MSREVPATRGTWTQAGVFSPLVRGATDVPIDLAPYDPPCTRPYLPATHCHGPHPGHRRLRRLAGETFRPGPSGARPPPPLPASQLSSVKFFSNPHNFLGNATGLISTCDFQNFKYEKGGKDSGRRLISRWHCIMLLYDGNFKMNYHLL